MNWSRKRTGATGAELATAPVFTGCSSYFEQLEHNWSNWSSRFQWLLVLLLKIGFVSHK